MNRWIRMYWEERLNAGRIFAYPTVRTEGTDFLTRGEWATPEWPSYVSKDALYNDYVAWAQNRPGASVPMADWYRQMQPFLYIHGRDFHTSRRRINGTIFSGARALKGKIEVRYCVLRPIGVMQAQFGMVINAGGLSQRAAWRRIIETDAALIASPPVPS